MKEHPCIETLIWANQAAFEYGHYSKAIMHVLSTALGRWMISTGIHVPISASYRSLTAQSVVSELDNTPAEQILAFLNNAMALGPGITFVVNGPG